MITAKKSFVLNKSDLGRKFRVENNNLDISSLVKETGLIVKRIGEIAYAHRNERNRKETADKIIKYVQISDIDVSLGRIKSYRKFKGAEAPNNARRIMNYGDVLVSTRRPTRGAVVAVPREFDQEICTVFFTSLKIKDWNVIDPWYLALFLRTSFARFQFQAMITETAYPVISDEDVENMIVLIPDIGIQKKLINNYNAAVNVFFAKMNDAYNSIISTRQEIENVILGDYAENLEPIRFGLEVEEIESEENGNSIEENGNSISENGNSISEKIDLHLGHLSG